MRVDHEEEESDTEDTSRRLLTNYTQVSPIHYMVSGVKWRREVEHLSRSER